MLLVDAHTHIGNERLFSITMKADDLLRTIEKNKLDKVIVQPQAGAPDIKQNHEAIAELTVKYPGVIYGLASFNPVTEDEKGFLENVRWAIKDLGFKGIKLHTNGFVVSPLNPYSRKIFEAGAAYSVPVMVHTGAGVPQALPSLCIPIARKYPDLKIVLAHAGGGLFACEALIVAQECPNIYLETSWVSPPDIAGFVASLGARRVMFGSDLFENVAPFLSIFYHAGFSEEQLAQVLGRTAIDVFKL
jgi:predicted TIM-barrel fold metal-dependent hydrolase